MKIAFVTDDGQEISRHFGRAGKYLVVEINDGKEVKRELREKMGHQHFASQHTIQENTSGPHGFDPDSQSKHASMISIINDCDVVVCGGMGRGAFQSIQESGKDIFMVENPDINQNLKAFLSGNLSSSEKLVH